MHEWSVTKSCLTLCDSMDCSPPGSSDCGTLHTRTVEWVAMPSPGGLPNPGIEPRSPALRVDSLPSEPPVKPKNTGVGSLSLLQGIFPTQESTWGLLHCRLILYSWATRGAPRMVYYLQIVNWCWHLLLLKSTLHFYPKSFFCFKTSSRIHCVRCHLPLGSFWQWQ